MTAAKVIPGYFNLPGMEIEILYCTVYGPHVDRAPKLPSSRFGFGNFQKLPETSKRKFPYLKKVSIVDNATGIYTTPIYSRQIKNSVYTAVLYCI